MYPNGSGGNGRGRRPPQQPLTPDQLLYGCLAVVGVVLLSLLFWVWFWWRAIRQDLAPPQPTPTDLRRNTKVRTPTTGMRP